MRAPVGLTIAGTDPVGGAGITADLMVLRAWGYHGALAVTSVIAQSTRGVEAAWPLAPEQVAAQVRSALEDLPVAVIKVGVLGSGETARGLAPLLRAWRAATPAGRLVLDPVLRSGQNGAGLGGDAVAAAVVESLLGCCDVITPNGPEAAALTGLEVTDEASARAAGRRLVALGARAALIKAGHLTLDSPDVLVWSRGDGEIEEARLPLPQRHPFEVRGTGCHLASAVACALGQGREVLAAVEAARAYCDGLWASQAQALGQGARVFVHAASGQEPG